ncbi:hypothetical protein KC711_07280 [Candidatus Peregrinibacteria bacterium]|nr:hypothetical protein [Candidatus Peregrinibacteria bacterium]
MYNAQTIQEFNSLCKNRHNTMQEWSYKNLDRMAQLYRVDTAEQFEFFCENEHVIRFLNNHPNGILNEIVVSLAVDPREFETFSDTFPVRDDYDWLPTMVNFLNIKTLQEFSVFCNTEGYTVLCKISEADIYDVL